MKTKYLLTAVATVVLGCWGLPALAQETTTVDVTADLVVNAACDVNWSGWERDSRCEAANFVVNASQLNSSEYTGPGVEFWTPNALGNGDLIYQDLSLPNGTYKLTAYAMARNSSDINDVNAAYVFAGTVESNIITNVWSKHTVEATVTDNTLRVGIRVKEGNQNRWLAITNTKLEWVGAELAFYQSLLTLRGNEMQEKLTDLDGLIPTPLIDNLKNQAAGDNTTVETCKTSIASLETLLSTAEADKQKFNVAYLALENYAKETLPNALNADESAKSTLSSAIEATHAKAFGSADATVWAEANKDLKAACKAFYDASSGIKEGVTNFDMTPLVVKNAGFDEENPVDGWVGLNATEVQEGILVKSYNTWGGYDFSQTVSQLPHGVYTMSVQINVDISDRHWVYLRSSYEGKETMLKWGGAHNLDAIKATWEKNTEDKRWTVSDVLVMDGNITMGSDYRKVNMNGSFCYDNFRLIRVNDGFDRIKGLYDAQKVEADKINQEDMLSVFAEALTQALALPTATVDEYVIAYNTLKKAVDDCNGSLDVINKLKDLIPVCNSYLDNSIAGDDAKSVFRTTIGQADEYRSQTTVEGIQTLYNNLEMARRVYAEVAIPQGDVKFDMTYLLTNPDLTNFTSWTKYEGWYTDTDKNIQCMHNDEVKSTDGKNAFYEIYAGSKTSMPMGDILYQKATLPVGSYEMSAYAYGKGVNDGYVGDFSGNFFAGDVKGDAVTAAILTKGGVSFVQSEAKEIKLGLYSDGTGTANWAGIGYMELYKVAPVAVDLTLNETEAYAVTTTTYANVTMTRTLKADMWNTFCVPFEMTAEQIASNKLGEVRELKGVEEQGGDKLVLTFETVEKVVAGVPYIVKPTEAVSSVEVDGVFVNAVAPTPLQMNIVTMQGNYAAMNVPQGAFFINNNVFYEADVTNVSLKGFRAYITIEEGSNEVNRMLINIDGEVTGIEEVLGSETSDEAVDVYTLSGVKMKSGVKRSEALDGLQRGIYVVNGEKVVK